METIKNPPLDPLGEVPISPTIAALPKADLHLHQQWSPRPGAPVIGWPASL